MDDYIFKGENVHSTFGADLLISIEIIFDKTIEEYDFKFLSEHFPRKLLCAHKKSSISKTKMSLLIDGITPDMAR